MRKITVISMITLDDTSPAAFTMRESGIIIGKYKQVREVKTGASGA